jgi:hypothetical protein
MPIPAPTAENTGQSLIARGRVRVSRSAARDIPFGAHSPNVSLVSPHLQLTTADVPTVQQFRHRPGHINEAS